jgi:hypothetical protein
LGFMSRDVHSCTHWLRETPQPPSPAFKIRITRALLVSKDRGHLFVTPAYSICEHFQVARWDGWPGAVRAAGSGQRLDGPGRGRTGCRFQFPAPRYPGDRDLDTQVQ